MENNELEIMVIVCFSNEIGTRKTQRMTTAFKKSNNGKNTKQ